jgi:hypothetical protein
MKNHADIEARASQWLVEHQDADFSSDQRSQFESWLAEDPAHKEVYDAIDRAWRRTDELRKKLKPYEELRKQLTHRIRCSRDLDVEEAERLAQGALSLLLTVGDTEKVELPCSSECTAKSKTHLVANNIARDWFSVSCDHYERLDSWFTFSCSRNVEHFPSSWFVSRTKVPSQESVASEFKRIVGQIVESLPHNEQCAITLYKGYGYSADEIAGKLSMSTDVVSCHLQHAVYRFVSTAINTFSPEQQAVFFAPLVAQANARRRGLG